MLVKQKLECENFLKLVDIIYRILHLNVQRVYQEMQNKITKISHCTLSSMVKNKNTENVKVVRKRASPTRV